MKQRRILNDISPDFKRDTQTQEEYIARKKAQIIDFVKRYLTSSGAKGIVLGVSGGIDSFLVSALCAQACADIGRQMYIVLLPNGRQPDIDDARACAEQIKKINPNTMCDTVSIANGYAGAIKDLEGAQGFSRDT